MEKNVAVIPGDGTGPDVAREGIKVLQAAASAIDLSCRSKAARSSRYSSSGTSPHKCCFRRLSNAVRNLCASASSYLILPAPGRETRPERGLDLFVDMS